MVNIKIDKEMLISELYNLRKYISIDNDEALAYLSRLVDLIMNAPTAENKSQYPHIKSSRGL